jgi:microsomal dipeptidase-like Zn-dependent dipeptidase
MDTLNAGDSLATDEALRSANGRYVLLMQTDGNLVLYDGEPSVKSAVWATNTWGLPDENRPVRADMQTDGNFVLYSAFDIPAWATGTDRHPGARLVLQDDRNLVVYSPDNHPLWASNTWVAPEPVPIVVEPAPAERHVEPQPVQLGGDYWQGGYDFTEGDGAPVWGFADLHAHPVSHLGFGGNLFWGRPDGPIDDALGWCTSMHGAGGTGLFTSHAAKPLGSLLVGFVEGQPNVMPAGLPGYGHLVGGYPQFDGWPRFSSLIHQKMYIDWIRRAYEGGLRLMVALVVNNEVLAWASTALDKRDPKWDDRTAVETQIQAIKELVGRHGDFMEIAYTPADARRIVAANKLAVVLGVEVDSLGNWGHESDVADAEEVATYLRHLYDDLGVRHIFPIHLANNAFGGTAAYNGLFNLLNVFLRGEFLTVRGAPLDFRLEPVPGSPDYDQVAVGQGHANDVPLTRLGRTAIEEMMRLGMIVDVDHMSELAVDETLTLAERQQYPVVAGHTAFHDLAVGVGEGTNEYQRTREQLKRIRRLGGMIAVGLHQSELRTFAHRVPNDAPGSAKSWAQAFLYAASQMQGVGVGVGTDINGLAGVAGPRFGLNACYDIHSTPDEAGERRWTRRAHVYAQRDGVRYQEPIRDYRAYRFEGVLERDVYDMEQRDVWEAIAIFKSGTDPDTAEMPGPLRRTWWQNGKIKNIAKGFRATSEDQLENPLAGGNTYNEQRAAFLVGHGREPEQDAEEDLKRLCGVIRGVWERWHAMERPGQPPLRRSFVGPQRDYDINVDGVAHYGLLPDFLQDLRNVGVTQKELSPLFRSAEDYIRVWERCSRRRAPVPARNDADLVGRSIPGTLVPGARGDVSVTMRNVGSAQWTSAAGYRLGLEDTPDAGAWPPSRIDLAGPVPPGSETTFRFSITAPAEQRPSVLRWRMLQEGVGFEWFGDSTPDTTIYVAQPEHPECAGLALRIQELRDEVVGHWADMADPDSDKAFVQSRLDQARETLGAVEKRARELECPPV